MDRCCSREIRIEGGEGRCFEDFDVVEGINVKWGRGDEVGTWIVKRLFRQRHSFPSSYQSPFEKARTAG